MRQQAIENENTKRHRHKDATERQEVEQWRGTVMSDELRQERKKEQRDLRVKDVEQECLDNQAACCRMLRRRLQRKRALVAPGGVGHIEQVGNTGVLEHLERQRAGVHYRR